MNNSSILDVEELLRDDSFMPLVEDEVMHTATFYLKQWKERAEELELNAHNATVTVPANSECPSSAHPTRFGLNPNLVDTRTFTRPKKQPFQPVVAHPFLNETIAVGGGSSSSSSQPSPGVHLQIGGLVTATGRGGLPLTMTQSSMQKSLIGDTSPPSSICSSTVDLVADRPPVNNETFLNGAEEEAVASAALNSLNGFNMEDVKREIEMLQNLTFDGLLRDHGGGGIVAGGSDATVVIESVDRTFAKENSFLVKNNLANGTFDLIGEEEGPCGRTVLMATEEEEEEEQNSTFNLTKCLKKSEETVVIKQAEPEDTQVNVDEDEIHLEFDRDSFIQSTPICRDKGQQNDIFNFSPTGNDHLYEMNRKNNAFKVPKLPQRFTTTTNQSSAPACGEEKEVVDEKTVIAAPRLGQTLDLGESSPEYEDVPELRRTEPGVPVDMLRPEERQSLVNFEEYEKSLQLLDDNRNERDFDEMLASINTQDMRQSTERLRQSLDMIKKRHSLINYERQQEELRRKVNDIDQEINNLTMEGSASGPRLLSRRSRLFDEQQQPSQPLPPQETIMDRTMELGTAATLQQAHAGTAGERRSVPEKRDRDRFKTIKILRKPTNSNIPDADETSIGGLLGSGVNATQLVREDLGGQEADEGERAPPMAVAPRGLQRPSRIMTRPRFGSGLQRPSQLGIAAQKASSADDLLDSRRGGEEEPMQRQGSQERGQSVQRGTISQMTTGKLKSPMGVKSKSIHNLMVNGGTSRIGGGVGRMSAHQEMKPYSTNTFKVPKGNVGGGVVAASGHASGTFQRPSTAASGTAKGSASGGVTMRSSKSIGGVQRPVSAVLIPSSALNIRQESVHPYSDGPCLPVDYPESRPGLAAPRASGLRPPSGIARPTGAIRSGLPRLSSIPRR